MMNFSTLVSTCEKRKNPELALDAFATMQRRAVAPNVVSMDTLLQACFASSQWERAVACFTEFVVRGLGPGRNSYSMMIKECEQRGLLHAEVAVLLTLGQAYGRNILGARHCSVIRLVRGSRRAWPGPCPDPQTCASSG